MGESFSLGLDEIHLVLQNERLNGYQILHEARNPVESAELSLRSRRSTRNRNNRLH
jgi:hypothetical protein